MLTEDNQQNVRHRDVTTDNKLERKGSEPDITEIELDYDADDDDDDDKEDDNDDNEEYSEDETESGEIDEDEMRDRVGRIDSVLADLYEISSLALGIYGGKEAIEHSDDDTYFGSDYELNKQIESDEEFTMRQTDISEQEIGQLLSLSSRNKKDVYNNIDQLVEKNEQVRKFKRTHKLLANTFHSHGGMVSKTHERFKKNTLIR